MLFPRVRNSVHLCRTAQYGKDDAGESPCTPTLGHAAGDEVLRQAAKRMLGAIREVDALGRYGGEEFMVVLGGCDNLDGAMIVAERIRSRMAETSFSTEFGEIPVTLSLGLAFSDSPSHTDEQLLVRAADEALYRAKHAGRNRVEAALLEPTPKPARKSA